MTAEFGEIICFIPLANCNKKQRPAGIRLGSRGVIFGSGRGALISYGTSECGTRIQ